MAVPGTTTGQDLIDDVRDGLAAWFIPATLDGAINDTTTSVTIDAVNQDFVGQKALLEIGTEIMLVTDIVSSTNYTVVRGYQGSTAASHLDNASVKIHPSWSWTDRMLLKLINLGCRWLRPAAWIHETSADFTWSNDTLEATPPAAVDVNFPNDNFVLKVEFKTDSGSYIPFHGWELRGDVLRFKRKSTQDRTLRVITAKFQPQLATVAATLDNDDFREAIALYSQSKALNQLKANRARFLEYSAALNDRASTPDELIRVAFSIMNDAVLQKEQHAKLMPPTFTKTYREPEN